MGLVIFAVMGLYLLISVFVVIATVNHAKKKNKSVKRWGWSAALAMFLIPFWDWIPTVATHQYYCATEAGFWVYKTPEQWKKENPGVMETLVARLSIQHMPSGDIQTLDDRFTIETHREMLVPGLSTQRIVMLLVDQKTGEVLAKSIGVGSGYGNLATGGGYKFWLLQKPCVSNGILDLSTAIQNMRGRK